MDTAKRRGKRVSCGNCGNRARADRQEASERRKMAILIDFIYERMG
jgi:hypothetical protein